MCMRCTHITRAKRNKQPKHICKALPLYGYRLHGVKFGSALSRLCVLNVGHLHRFTFGRRAPFGSPMPFVYRVIHIILSAHSVFRCNSGAWRTWPYASQMSGLRKISSTPHNGAADGAQENTDTTQKHSAESHLYNIYHLYE